MGDAEIWGYARVSSTSQNLDRQLEQLRAYGID
ncbi:MAG: recombinase family protein, partial [Ruminococcus sp.]|nr:recombinase family protein [Ruminococcus sp.]